MELSEDVLDSEESELLVVEESLEAAELTLELLLSDVVLLSDD